MDFYKINSEGNIQIEAVPTLPTWVAADERRIIYVEDENSLYFGGNTEWIKALGNSEGLISDDDVASDANINATKIGTGVVDNTEFNRLNGLTSPIVTRSGTDTLTNKSITNNFEGNIISNIINDNIRADANINATKIGTGVVDNTEFNRLNGITSPLVSASDSVTLTNKTINADNNTITNIGDDEIKSGVNASKISSGNVTNTEFDRIRGLASYPLGIFVMGSVFRAGYLRLVGSPTAGRIQSIQLYSRLNSVAYTTGELSKGQTDGPFYLHTDGTYIRFEPHYTGWNLGIAVYAYASLSLDSAWALPAHAAAYVSGGYILFKISLPTESTSYVDITSPILKSGESIMVEFFYFTY